ncbi:hypothetical protein [Clostridium sp.]|jgi:hypothetical protein|uniref:hypothetical protein n=1 Tax=Clostridium sp. TaxID=1506 RepID=UPI0039F5A8CE
MFDNIIHIILNIFLGISLVGTGSCIVLFIIMKVRKLDFIASMLSKFCVLFIITWIIFIVCNIYVAATYTSPSTTSMALLL